MTATGASAESHVDNPYAGAVQYVNPTWSAAVTAAAGRQSDATLKAQMPTVAQQPTAVWMDRISAIEGNADGQGLKFHLDNAAAQQGRRLPLVLNLVIYDLPGRDCSALASNGELGADGDRPRYKTEYIDAIAAIMSNSKYASLRIVTIIEPDSLPNLLTNTNIADCQEMISNGNYIAGVTHALNKLHAIPNVYTYVDAAHHGWLGWDDNASRRPSCTSVARATTAGFASIDGFIVNTANTSAGRALPKDTAHHQRHVGPVEVGRTGTPTSTSSRSPRTCTSCCRGRLPLDARLPDRHQPQRLGRSRPARRPRHHHRRQHLRQRVPHRPPPPRR